MNKQAFLDGYLEKTAGQTAQRILEYISKNVASGKIAPTETMFSVMQKIFPKELGNKKYISQFDDTPVADATRLRVKSYLKNIPKPDDIRQKPRSSWPDPLQPLPRLAKFNPYYEPGYRELLEKAHYISPTEKQLDMLDRLKTADPRGMLAKKNGGEYTWEPLVFSILKNHNLAKYENPELLARVGMDIPRILRAGAASAGAPPHSVYQALDAVLSTNSPEHAKALGALVKELEALKSKGQSLKPDNLSKKFLDIYRRTSSGNNEVVLKRAEALGLTPESAYMAEKNISHNPELVEYKGKDIFGLTGSRCWGNVCISEPEQPYTKAVVEGTGRIFGYHPKGKGKEPVLIYAKKNPETGKFVLNESQGPSNRKVSAEDAELWKKHLEDLGVDIPEHWNGRPQAGERGLIQFRPKPENITDLMSGRSKQFEQFRKLNTEGNLSLAPSYPPPVDVDRLRT